MKNKIVKKVFLSAVFLLIIFPAAVYAIEVGFYIGNVTVTRGGKKIAINTGSSLEGGDVIKTGKDATIELLYKDGSKVTILENSSARVGSVSIKGSDDVALVSGNLTGKFSKLKKGSHKVYTPTTVCSIRGTEFQIGVCKNGESRVDLNKGNLDVNNPYGKTNMNSGDKTDIGIGKKPTEGSGDLKDWQNKENKDFDKNPGETSKDYNGYMNTFGKRSKDTSKDMDGYNTMVKNARSKSDVENAGGKINAAEDNTTDDLLLNETANATIGNIVDDFKNRRGKIYNEFLQIKKESNKVMEQQQKNYEEIQKVKAAYREAYEKIIGKYHEDFDNIKKGFQNKNLKPDMNFNENKE